MTVGSEVAPELAGLVTSYINADKTILRVVNVAGYGAVGDNSTNDTAAITAAVAVAAASGQKILWFPHTTAAVYKVSASLSATLAGYILLGDNVSFSGIADVIQNLGSPSAAGVGGDAIDDTVAVPTDSTAVASQAVRNNQFAALLKALKGTAAWFTAPAATIAAIWAKFHATTGHAHTGAANDAPLLTTLGTIGTGTWQGTAVGIAYGGTGQATAAAGFDALSPMTTLGDLIYGGAVGTRTRLAGNTTATKKFLRQTGDGAASAAPAWDTVTQGDVGLGNVENTALSTWAGTANITTLGTIGTGVWNATAIADGKIASALTGKTYNGLTPTAQAVGFTIAGGTTSKTLTVPLDASVAGTNTGDQTITLTGDVTGSGTGSFAATIANNAVTLAKMATMATASLLGRNTAGVGNVEVLDAATVKGILSLGNVENTALSTWAGTANITTLGTIGTGTWQGTAVGIAYGGTGQATAAAGFDALSPMTTLGDLIYGGAAGTRTRLAGNTTATKKFLRQTGDGANSAAPAWDTVVSSDVGLGNVENTALSTWAGTANITTLGTIGAGTWQGTAVGIAYGGTGQATAAAGFDALSPMSALGDVIYGGAAGTRTRLAGNTTATKKFLRQTGDGANSAAPAWDTVVASDVGLGSVENTALSTWAGTANITTLGTITSGTWNGTAVTVAYGGTGLATLTAYAVMAAGTTATGNMQQVSGVGTSGQVLTSNGAGALPTWQAAAGGTNVQIGFAIGTTDSPTTTSSTLVLAPEMSVTLTTHTGGTTYVIHAHTLCSTSSTYSHIGLKLDSDAAVSAPATGDPDYVSLVQMRSYTGLSAASHTWEGHWRNASGSTAYSFGVARYMFVIEIW